MDHMRIARYVAYTACVTLSPDECFHGVAEPNLGSIYSMIKQQI